MCNIINTANQQKIVIRTPFYCYFVAIIESKIPFKPANIQTANEYLVNTFARGKAYSYPLQDPIKNIICYPE